MLASLTTSYATNSNWQGKDYRNFSFAGSINYRHALVSGNWQHQHLFIADLSYLKFIDSIWIKNTDRLNMNLLWSEDGHKFRHSYAINFNTQMLPSYTYRYDYETGQNHSEKISYVFCPATLDLGYGMVRNFWNASNLNLAFATLKLSSYPLINGETPEQQLAHGKNAWYKMEYGLALSTNIRKPIGERVEWWNDSKLFCNAINRDQVTFDFNNKIIVKLLRYLQLRFDTRMSYQPLINYKLQFSQEVTLGVFFEKARQH